MIKRIFNWIAEWLKDCDKPALVEYKKTIRYERKRKPLSRVDIERSNREAQWEEFVTSKLQGAVFCMGTKYTYKTTLMRYGKRLDWPDIQSITYDMVREEAERIKRSGNEHEAARISTAGKIFSIQTGKKKNMAPRDESGILIKDAVDELYDLGKIPQKVSIEVACIMDLWAAGVSGYNPLVSSFSKHEALGENHSFVLHKGNKFLVKWSYGREFNGLNIKGRNKLFEKNKKPWSNSTMIKRTVDSADRCMSICGWKDVLTTREIQQALRKHNGGQNEGNQQDHI